MTVLLKAAAGRKVLCHHTMPCIRSGYHLRG